jgi:glycosyltransferase involved in cell wall biosynthesis
VDRFIALTAFAREKFLAAGFPPQKLVVKPNFVHPDPGPGAGRGGYALFVGRLSPEKGVGTLLAAWEALAGRVPLRVVGDGPLGEEVRRAAARLPGVEWLGWRSPQEVLALMGEAAFLVFPSEWYEGFPRVLVEAFARGLPVLCSGMGSHGSLVEHGRTGLHFRPGDPQDLAEKVEWMLAHPANVAAMRREARREYEETYTAERNYGMLMDIYGDAIAARRVRPG